MNGLFIGLTTLDLIYQAAQPPTPNQKMVASDYTVSAGGPATNAAVAFSYLGSQSALLSVIGRHPMTHLILADLQQWGVTMHDLDSTRIEPPPVSSIIVTQTTGERAVISINAVKTPAKPEDIPIDILQKINLREVDIVLIDGHQIGVGAAIAQQAKANNIPVIIDGGSWKPGFEMVLPFVDYAICSANFHPPNCPTEVDVVAFLQQFSIPHIAITHGAEPICYWTASHTGTIPVPAIQATDTLGAGDIFHGAFCHAILHTAFSIALENAAQVAAFSCQFFGTRRWMGSREWGVEEGERGRL
jgi:sugar/nucleoside kinase (ribokinase family)